MGANYPAAEARAKDELFVSQCSLDGLRDKLPLRWPLPPDIPPSPKKQYRSEYVYLGWDDLNQPEVWENLSDFDLLLRLVDFGHLRPVLAHLLGWNSALGQVPFDPVSIFLLICWQIVNGWSRAKLLRQLSKPRYADYARRFGFSRDKGFPTEGGLRYYQTTLGRNSDSLGEWVTVLTEDGGVDALLQALNRLIVQSVTLMVEAGLISQAAWDKALLCPDGMLLQAASRMKCSSVTDTCYEPTSTNEPRPCPAKDKKRHGCQCDTLKCAQVCQYAPAREPEARFVWYSGSNKDRPNPNQPLDDTQKRNRGKGVFGYRSLALQWADPERRFSVILLDDVRPANQNEQHPVAALLRSLPQAYPTLRVDTVAGDANFGVDSILSVVYDQLKARRVIDLHGHDTDKDKSHWPLRGYDDKGRPVCRFGYRFTANGFDFDRQRHKWMCNRACLNDAEPVVDLPDTPRPPRECPYLKQDHPTGHIINIAKCFPSDGSIRLVRDVPVGTPTWKQLYHRARNAVEGRNSDIEDWRLKRMPVYGLPRAKTVIFLADVLINLTTLARLVREATTAARAP